MTSLPKIATHPFSMWLGQLASLGAATLDGGKNNDIKLSDLGSKRMSLGIYNNQPLLCFLPEDKEAIQSVRWSAAAVLMNLQDKDWIALSAKDIRPQGLTGVAYPARLFIPVAHGRLQAWHNAAIQPQVHLGVMTFPSKGGAPTFEGVPFLTLPAILKYNGDLRLAAS